APLVDPGRWDYHDFRLFYDAAAAFARGEDPYAVSVELGRFRLGYLYAPVTLPLFVPFTWLSFEAACIAYLSMKLAALAALIVLWYRLLPRTTGAWFLPFCLLSFNSAIYIDIEVGNTEVFLQLFLWIGLALFVAGRYRAFASLVLAAALFKLTPLLLLALLALAPKPREALRQALAPVLGFIVLIVLSLYLEPAWVRSLGEDVGRNVA